MADDAKSMKAGFATEKVQPTLHPSPPLDEPARIFTVDGIPLLPGEGLRDYHARALAWITIEAVTSPVNNRFLSRRQFVARLVAIPVFLALALQNTQAL